MVPVVIAPLRERTEDIPIFARHFLEEFCAAYGRKPRELSAGAIEVMLQYPWPGNVRELRNVIERLVIMCPDERIEAHHLPPELFRGLGLRNGAHASSTLVEARQAYEREMILRKLEENHWNMKRTAASLGMERSHLYRKMKSLGISSEEN